MKEIDITELKRIQVDILKHVDEFCREKGIKYSLYAGTLLGAVRHRGFIPWDDDIDIMMKRSDYERFFKEYSKEDHSNYQAQEFRFDTNYHYPFGKVTDTRTILREEVLDPYENLGVYIDVFPIENLPNNKFSIWFMYFFHNIFFQIKSYKQTPALKSRRGIVKNFILKTLHVLFSPFSVEFCIKMMIWNARRYEGRESRYCGDVVGGYKMKEVQQSSNFSSYLGILVEK